VGVPEWLRQRLETEGGAVPFRTYMEWALHDPTHGAYGSGRLRVGPGGDFATAPSLGPDFAALLAAQVADWLLQLDQQRPPDSTAGQGPQRPLALVEAGPGEGSLALDLAVALAGGWPELAARTELVLVEPNPGMARRQRQRLAACPLPCRWSSFAQLAAVPLQGVLLAHEVLDALAVERIAWDGALWRQQRVVLHAGAGAEPSLRLEPGEPLEPDAAEALHSLGLLPPSPQRPAGWCTELHPGLEPWLAAAAGCFSAGALLVIDYALEAWRYYAPQRSNGTLLAYRAQRAAADPLLDPGWADLTAHLCIDSLERAATATGWQALGGCRQGEALLALGLAQRLHGLQGAPGGLANLLARREALLRLVDPHALGDFRWLAFSRSSSLPPPRFLREPHLPIG
jgi:SAM-dependent MidA family methyltransferase